MASIGDEAPFGKDEKTNLLSDRLGPLVQGGAELARGHDVGQASFAGLVVTVPRRKLKSTPGKVFEVDIDTNGDGVADYYVFNGENGGFAATGAIARTTTNVRTGGRTPIAGMIHAVVLLAMGFLGPEQPLLESLNVERDPRSNARADFGTGLLDSPAIAAEMALGHPVMRHGPGWREAEKPEQLVDPQETRPAKAAKAPPAGGVLAGAEGVSRRAGRQRSPLQVLRPGGPSALARRNSVISTGYEVACCSSSWWTTSSSGRFRR